jgi:hypothetical protein
LRFDKKEIKDMKRYELIFTEEEDGTIRCDTTNEGFSGIELLSFLEVKRDDLKAQLYNNTKFTRTLLDMNGIKTKVNKT